MLFATMETGGYPNVALLVDDAFAMPSEAFLEFGLQRLLDGIEVLVDGRHPSGS